MTDNYTFFDYNAPFDISNQLPIPPKMIESSMNIIQKESNQQFDDIQRLVNDMGEARSKLEPIIRLVDDREIYTDYYGIDGGLGISQATIGGTYSSVVGVAYPAHKSAESYMLVDPIVVPAGLGAPHQNYFEMWMKRYELAVASRAVKRGDCILFDGTLVPTVFALFLRSAADYEALRPDFLTMFQEAFVSKPNKRCLVDEILDSNVPLVGLPKRSHSRNIINTRLRFMKLPMFMSDLMACSLLLNSGEYIAPMEYKTIYQMQSGEDDPLTDSELAQSRMHWNTITKLLREPDEIPKQAGLDASIETIPYMAENTLVTYFKPISGSIAIRVEFLRRDLAILPKILATIQIDFDKISRLPFCVYMADTYSKSNKNIPLMIKTSIANKLIKIASQRGVTDPNTLWYINELSSSLGSQMI